ncbi:hypothetical protein PoB_004869500 [Plakobranchus ocellatus]|uniref:Uncharacterized protein n=1 Tax=Plakobranchus ocellatus TaxID=259542 RepID=A0AAV4BSE3_9GAST|nr:hypothetical protein PoB_004869500 [Plakobranchus ocellatus]
MRRKRGGSSKSSNKSRRAAAAKRIIRRSRKRSTMLTRRTTRLRRRRMIQYVNNKVISGIQTLQGAGGGARTRDRRIPADIRADSLATVPSTPSQRRL